MLSNEEVTIRLLLACFVGCGLGFQRRKSHKPVGKRTHVLISVASCLLTMVSAYGFTDLCDSPNVSVDLARLVVGIMTGIGFIGAGIIWRGSTGSVQGITTAADILLLAVIGITIGLGLYYPAMVAFVIAMVALESNTIEDRFKRRMAKRAQAKAEKALQEKAALEPPENAPALEPPENAASSEAQESAAAEQK